jgi:hypothetical protein
VLRGPVETAEERGHLALDLDEWLSLDFAFGAHRFVLCSLVFIRCLSLCPESPVSGSHGDSCLCWIDRNWNSRPPFGSAGHAIADRLTCMLFGFEIFSGSY